MFGAHFGNWELAADSHFAALKACRSLSIVLWTILSLNNLVAYGCGPPPAIRLVPKERAMRQMLRSLKKNEILGIMIDQNMAWQEGVFVDFFGRPACTTNGLALLALHTEAPVIPGYIVRLENGKYRLVIKEEMEIIRTGDEDADILINTQNFTRVIEDTVREYPDQWLWIHQRWKTKPWQVAKNMWKKVPPTNESQNLNTHPL